MSGLNDCDNPLACPHCREPIALEMKSAQSGIGRCACRQWPIAEGVMLYPDDGDGPARQLLDAIAHEDSARARRIVLGRHATRVKAAGAVGMRMTFGRFVRHRVMGEIIGN